MTVLKGARARTRKGIAANVHALRSEGKKAKAAVAISMRLAGKGRPASHRGGKRKT